MDSSSPPSSTPFGIDNIPFGVISTRDNPAPRCATAFEDHAVDLSCLEKDGLFASIPGFGTGVFSQPNLNTFASLPRPIHAEVRKKLVDYLASADISREEQQKSFILLSQVTNHLPMNTANYTDFYCSLEHARNCSEVIGLEVNPNWYCIPSCYNGRTSSLRISGDPIRRPWGLEMGVYVSKPLPAGQILDMRQARDHIFGLVLLNDWSARDIQAFEMNPLGPFHSKGFGTTVSPWIVTMEALEPVECERVVVQDPRPLGHLAWRGVSEREAIAVELSAKILRNGKTYHVTTTNLNELYWTPYQQLTHLASAGEGLCTGDILGTGTLSSSRVGPTGEKIGLACLLERAIPRNMLSALKSDGIVFLEDGDEVVFEGWCRSPHSGKWFGFGECRAVVLPALDLREV
ncbi:2-hydroxyhepta-2,4-diene-1,7-dioate isomerase [Aspergillus steynii IBT 23096]|uniref:Fumarylacetoacetase n=1 Tax=Aspergillus steynii IBT 23096 TaxID=1392250 RepID=A0A2I2G669_9EURO|nr:2-hydroxyhepta-2,4-diene-1,7-dioate isomerase [Aspergillus steynii IBT 23096]PLB48374.1 2-hydroxyhepta-2,4-diene-1,7-dioate isomerase [Aspergillus steynii IBT 23096]